LPQDEFFSERELSRASTSLINPKHFHQLMRVLVLIFTKHATIQAESTSG